MNDHYPESLETFSHEQLEHLDKARDKFETELRSGNKPKIEQFIEKCEPDLREELLKDLIAIELELCEPGQRKELAANLKNRLPGKERLIEGLLIDLESTASINRSLPARQEKAKLGNYKLLQQIGEGGMGSVWMAEQEKPVKRRVAIKLIRSDIGSNEAIARFEAERQALAMMDHQNIAKVLDAGTTDDGSPYFVMELVKGIPITNFCDDNKLSIRERLELFIPVCNAVQHAHQKGIIHRDLKPSNVLVTLYDGKPVPKVIDFGLAKALEHTTKLTDKTMFTEFGKIVGTVQYMSPEQAEMNALDVDTRTDIYSLGVMLYELLTGSTPLDKETLGKNAILQILAIIREKEPPRPSHRLSSSGDSVTGISEQRKINPSKLQQILRGELDWIVMKALDKNRARRYETANGLAMDIERYLGNEPIVARPPSASYRLSKFLKKNRTFVATAFVIGFLLLAGIIGTSIGLLNANSLREKAEIQENIAKKEAKNLADALEIFVSGFEITDPDVTGNGDATAVDVLDSTVQNINANPDLDARVKAELFHAIGKSYLGLGKFDDAVEVFGEAYQLRKEIFSDHDLRSIKSLNNLALSLASDGHIEESLDRYKKTIEVASETLGEFHEITLGAHIGLVNCYDHLGKLNTALEINDKLIENVREHLGIDHEHYWRVQCSSASIHSKLGNFKKAIELQKEVVAWSESVNGALSKNTIHNVNELAVIYARAAMLQQAHQLFSEYHAISETKLGSKHPTTLNLNSNIGYCLGALGEDEKAIAVLEGVVNDLAEVIGVEHPDTINALNNLAGSYSDAGEYDRAKKTYERIFNIQKQKFGDKSRSALDAFFNLALVEYKIDRKNGLNRLKNCLAGCEQNFGPSDGLSVEVRYVIAKKHLEQGETDEALAILETAIKHSAKSKNLDRRVSFRLRYTHADLFVAVNQQEQGIALFKVLLEETRHSLGDDHPFAMEIKNRLNDLKIEN